MDDSGDPGFKIEGGSTLHFIIAMVIFDDELEAEKTAVRIKELKREMNFPEDFEFKFCKNSHIKRLEFLKAINQFNFRVRYIDVNKSLIRSMELRGNRNSFYSFFIKEILKHSRYSICDARIKIDGHGDRNFRKSFLGYLKREVNNSDVRIIENCKLVDSKGNVLIQLADMIAGTINRSLNLEKEDRGEYIKVIKNHIESGWAFK